MITFAAAVGSANAWNTSMMGGTGTEYNEENKCHVKCGGVANDEDVAPCIDACRPLATADDGSSSAIVAEVVAPNSCVHEDCKDWNCDKWCECFDGTSCTASVLFFKIVLSPAIAHSRFNLRSFFFFFFFFFLQRPRLRSTPPTTATKTRIRAIAQAGRHPATRSAPPSERSTARLGMSIRTPNAGRRSNHVQRVPST